MLDVQEWAAFRKQAYERSGIEVLKLDVNTQTLLIAAGLAEEAGEMSAAMLTLASHNNDFVKEAGDVFWHIAMMETLTNFRIDWNSSEREHYVHRPMDLLMAVGDILGACKRPIWGQSRRLSRFKNGMNLLASVMVNRVERSGHSIEYVLNKNIEKNHARFGDQGFTPLAADARSDEQPK
jgi:phosphoribosyl-ATP pyrophosphohydrolase